MTLSQLKSPSFNLERLLILFKSRSIGLLCIFLVAWSGLLWIFYNKQKALTTAEIVHHKLAEMESVSSKMSLGWSQSLFLGYELQKSYGDHFETSLIRGEFGKLIKTFHQEVDRSQIPIRLRVLNSEGVVKVDVSNMGLEVSHGSSELEAISPSIDEVKEVPVGGVKVSRLFPATFYDENEAKRSAFVHVYLPQFDKIDQLIGAVVMTYGFCSCQSIDFTGKEMILTENGFLFRSKGETSSGIRGFVVSDLPVQIDEIWASLHSGDKVVRNYPDKGGFTTAIRFQARRVSASFWKRYFTDIVSDLDFYVMNPVSSKEYEESLVILRIRLLGIWFGMSILAVVVFLWIRVKVIAELEGQKALFDQRELLSSLLNAIPFPILHIDKTGKRVGGNLSLVDNLNMKYQELGVVHDIRQEDDTGLSDRIVVELRKFLLSGMRADKVVFEYDHENKSQQFELYTTKYQNHLGENGGAIGVLVDVSHYKEHEIHLGEAKAQADRANNAKSAFLATMSHEIRTPLNGIIGMTSLMADTQMDDVQEEYVETIKASGETLLNLINDILDFSKIEADRIELEHIPMNIENIVCDVLDMLSKQAHLEDVDLVYRVDSDLKTELYGDPIRLKQVITNLVSNAVKFTQKGSIVVSIERVIDAPHRIQLSVTDTGIGIDPSRIGSLFDPFVQEDSSTTRRFGGTGLGLAICKRLVAVMGGDLVLESEPGVGSTFSFSLPIGAVIEDMAPDNSQTHILSYLSVLAIDDNPQSLSILTEILEEWKMEVHGFTDPEVALKWLTDGNHCDVVIADHLMPEMDGETFCQKASSYLRGKERLTPLLLMCALEHEPDPNYVTKAVHKPLHRDRIKDSLVYVLSRQPKGIPKMVSHKGAVQIKFSEKYPMRVLIAEDNKVNQRVVKLILKKMGFEGIFVENGLQACKRYEAAMDSNPFDIILMDIQMPIMDGIEAGRQIREKEALSHSDHECCIIALSANVLDETRNAAMEVGFNDYLCKPVKLETLKHSFEEAWKYLNRMSPEKKKDARGAFFTADVKAGS